MVNAGTGSKLGKQKMTGSRVSKGAVALKLFYLLIELMVRRSLIGRGDLEHMVARLSMEAHRTGTGDNAEICRASADEVRSWLVALGDDPPFRPGLRLVNVAEELK